MAVDALPPRHRKREAVREMFDRIAPRYDVTNRVLTLGLDRRWRRAALERVAVCATDTLLDLACGTGDLAELARARGARVIGVDFAGEMLRRARRRLDSQAPGAPCLVRADVAALPFAAACASVVACGFALRNFVSIPEALAEMARVLRPGGRLALVEVDRPRSGMARAGHAFYFDRLVPKLGALLSDRKAYAYLPQSTHYLPPEPALREVLGRAGFGSVSKRALLLGSAQIVTAVRER